MNSLSERLQFYMRQTGYSAIRLSRDCGMNVTFVRDIIQKKVKVPALPGLLGLCRALEVAPHHLCPELLDAYPLDIQRILQKMPSDTKKRVSNPFKPLKFRSVEEKRRIVEETLLPGATVLEVSQRRKIHRNQIAIWRRKYMNGELDGTAITITSGFGRKKRPRAI